MKWSTTLGMLLACGITLAQANPLLPYLDCPVLNYFDEPCVLSQPSPALAPPPQPVSLPPPPLFTTDTMAKDTPPLLIQFLNDPTEANMKAYITWEAQRASRMQKVQRMLREYHQRQGQ